MGYKPIENYGVIGDLETVTLVGMDGAIDFMCFPEFDSPTIFGALLDHRKGGSFELAPVLKGAKNKQLYKSRMDFWRGFRHDKRLCSSFETFTPPKPPRASR